MITTEDAAWILRNPFGHSEPSQELFGIFQGWSVIFVCSRQFGIRMMKLKTAQIRSF